MEPNGELDAIIHDTLSLHCMHPLNMTTPEEDDIYHLSDSEPLSQAVDYLREETEELLLRLEVAVARRVGSHSYHCNECQKDVKCAKAHVAVMFSGGIDSMMLAYLTDKVVPRNEPIDLLNVAFQTSGDNYNVPDRVTGRQALAELSSLRKWNFVEVSGLYYQMFHWEISLNLNKTVYSAQVGCKYFVH